jgi:hypothetical protein
MPANACRVLAGFMSGVEGDIDSDMLVRLVPPGDKEGVMYLLPLKLRHPPDGRIALPATVVFRAASYRHPSERLEPRLIDDEYRLVAWPIERDQPFLVWRNARDSGGGSPPQ